MLFDCDNENTIEEIHEISSSRVLNCSDYEDDAEGEGMISDYTESDETSTDSSDIDISGSTSDDEIDLVDLEINAIDIGSDYTYVSDSETSHIGGVEQVEIIKPHNVKNKVKSKNLNHDNLKSNEQPFQKSKGQPDRKALELEKRFENTMEDPCKKYTGIDIYGQYVQKWSDPHIAYDRKTKQMKWSKKGMPHAQRKEFGSQQKHKEHPLKTLDKKIASEPHVEYQHVYFPEGELQKN